MNYATFAALTNYDTATAALAANTTNGDAWLLNETQIFQDGAMPKSGPAAAKNNRQTQMASSLTPAVRRNKGTASEEGYEKNSFVDYRDNNANNAKEDAANAKGPSIRHKVAWYVTDDTQTAGYRRVFGLLEDPATTAVGRDDDPQVRK